MVMRRRFRRRKTYKKRMPRRIRYKRRAYRASLKPEVKHIDITANELPMSVCDITDSTGVLGTLGGSGNKAIDDIFSYISQGTGSSNRIGSTIFVKSMQIQFHAHYCPNATFLATTGGASVPGPAIMQVRCVWADNNQGFTADSEGFFIAPSSGLYWGADIKRLNRRIYQFWHDRTFTSRNANNMGWPFGADSTVYTNANQLLPAMSFKYTVPVNKRIIYTQESLPKDDTMRYTLNVFACPPVATNMPTTAKFNELRKQLYCYSYQIRIYYTDV